MAQRTLLLDLDGTLWDSRPWCVEILARLSDRREAELKHKLKSGANIRRLARECGVTDKRFELEAAKSAASLRFYDGVLGTLDDLADRSTSMGEVTNLPGGLVKTVLRETGIAGHFKAVITPRIGLPAKPKPHGIRRALLEMGREADLHTWMVGDGVVDGQAAEVAGVRFAWASYGYEAVEPPNTDTVLRSFADSLCL